MIVQARHRRLALLSVALVAWFVPAMAARAPEGQKSVFVSLLDEAGKPVLGLTAEDFRVREDGVDREITGAGPATQPLQIALLADTTDAAGQYTRDIRVALSSFVRHVLKSNPDASIRLMEFGQAAIPVVPFSSSVEDLDKGINKLVPKPTAPSVLMEAILESSNDLAARPSPRRAIVSLNMEPSNEQSRQDPKRVNESLRKSVSQLWAVSLQARQVDQNSDTLKPGDMHGHLVNPSRDVALVQLTKNTGGIRDFIVGQSAMETALNGYADALTSQYEVTYRRPGSKKTEVVQVGTTRQGVKVHASGFAPQ
jgi:VWFA-related protein